MRKKNENYLERIFEKSAKIGWEADESGIVTLSRRNKGVANRLAQLILKKPVTSYIHLDEFGSFVWLCIDGKRDITEIGKEVKEHFGDSVEPLYERLAKYFQILSSNGFITSINSK